MIPRVHREDVSDQGWGQGAGEGEGEGWGWPRARVTTHLPHDSTCTAVMLEQGSRFSTPVPPPTASLARWQSAACPAPSTLK